MQNQLANLKKMYVCGPTVYDHSHLGHARTYITVDILTRIMAARGIRTHLVMNITDIDDKIIKKAEQTNNNWRTIAKIYEDSFFSSMAKLNVRLPDVIIRVSEVLLQIVAYIQKIIDNGFAYATSDGSVYFDSDAYVKQGYPFGDLVDEDETLYQSELSPLILLQKRNKKDFALWKGRKPDDVGFNAEFQYNGRTINSWGRPGWHIECSAMIHETIGPDIDIHFGGIDLKFPHHHNERLQAHSYYHPMFKNCCWSAEFHHVGHLCVVVKEDGQAIQQKMSKSLKNFTTIDDALKKINANQLRWLFILHKWSDPMDYSEDTIVHAKSFDATITNFFNRVINYPFDRLYVKYNQKESEMAEYFDSTKDKIMLELDSFHLDIAAGLLLELISKTNSYISTDYPNQSLVQKIYQWIVNLTNDLGFIYLRSSDNSTADVMNVLINTRSEIRALTRQTDITKEAKQKLFAVLDTERNISLPNIGITLQDTKTSSSWFKD